MTNSSSYSGRLSRKSPSDRLSEKLRSSLSSTSLRLNAASGQFQRLLEHRVPVDDTQILDYLRGLWPF